MTKQWAPLAVILLAVCLFFLNRLVRPDEPVRKNDRELIQLWCTATPAQTILHFKEQFERLHPEYELEVQTVAWNSLQEKTLWAVAAGSNVPDLILGSSEWTGGLVRSGALEPLDKHLPSEFFDQFFSNALGTYQFPEVDRDDPTKVGEVRQYGIPLDLDMMMVFYRQDIVQPHLEALGMVEFPRDWVDFKRLGEAVYVPPKPREIARHLIYLDPEDPVPMRMAFLPASGGSLFSKDFRRATFDSEESIAAFAYAAELIQDNVAKEWNQATQGNPMELVKSERIVGYIAGPWFCKLLESRAPELAGKWRVALFPKRAPEYYSTGLGGSCLAMPYNASNKAGAIALAKFLASPDFAIEYFERVGSPPPLRSAWHNPVFEQTFGYFGEQKVYRVVKQAIDDSRPLQLLPNDQVMKQYVRRSMYEIVARDAEATSTLRRAVEASNEVLGKGF